MSGAEDKITLPPDSTGKSQRERKLTLGGQTVYEDVVALDDGNGNLIDPRQVRSLTDSDHVTANAGSNLNTSALALETGGNLAAIKTDVDKLPSDPAREGGNLAAIKADTDKLPSDPAREGGNLATIATKAGTLALESGGNLASLNSKIVLPNGAVLLASFGIGIPDLTGVGLNGPRDAFELANGNWLITDMLNHRVIEVKPQTQAIVWQYGTTGVSGSGANHLNNPYSAIRLGNGDTLIADSNNNRIIEVTSAGAIVWTVTGTSLGLGTAIYPTSVQMTDEGTVICGGNSTYPHVLEIAYPSGTLACDWSANAVPAFSFPTYAHKIQGNEVEAATDFHHWHHMLVVDYSLGEFYNFNVNSGGTAGTLLFATPRYAPFGAHNLECVGLWSDRRALLSCPSIGSLVAYLKSEDLTSFALLFGNKTAGDNERGPPLIMDSGYCHRCPDGNLLISDYGACMVYKVIPNLSKHMPPSPLYLWSGQSITDTTNGATSLGFLAAYAEKITFYIKSTQSGILNIQVYDEVAAAYVTVDTITVAANTLTPYVMPFDARLVALNFIPMASATVSAWVVMK